MSEDAVLLLFTPNTGKLSISTYGKGEVKVFDKFIIDGFKGKNADDGSAQYSRTLSEGEIIRLLQKLVNSLDA